MQQVRVFLMVALAAFFAAMSAAPTLAQPKAGSSDLKRQVGELYAAGRFAEAAAMAERALAVTERQFGRTHLQVGTALNDVAVVYMALARYGEAETLLKRALTIYEKTLGSNDAATATTINNLASVSEMLGRLDDADRLYRRALAIREAVLGNEHVDVAASWNNIGLLDHKRGRYPQAEQSLRRALAMTERQLGASHPTVALMLNNLGQVQSDQGHYAEAETTLGRALNLREKVLGPNHPDLAVTLSNLASLHFNAGRLNAAEPLFRRAIAIVAQASAPDHPTLAIMRMNLGIILQRRSQFAEAEVLIKAALVSLEKTFGPNDPQVATMINNIAHLYTEQGRLADVEPLILRSLAARERALGRDHPDVAVSLVNLAGLYSKLGRLAEAEPHLARAIRVFETAYGPAHPSVGTALGNYGILLHDLGRMDEAEKAYRRALAIRETALGPSHPDTGMAINNLATYLFAQGKFDEAEPLMARAAAIIEEALGPLHPEVGLAQQNLAELHLSTWNWRKSVDAYQRSADVLISMLRRDSRDKGARRAGLAASESDREKSRFTGLIKALYRLSEPSTPPSAQAMEEGFIAAQWVQTSSTAATIAQMAARQATGGTALAKLVRERQDLAAHWATLDRALLAAIALPPDKRDAKAAREIRSQLAATDARIGEIDKSLAAQFPEFSALASPEPITMAQARNLLSDDEALIVVVDTNALSQTPDETFIWAMTRTSQKWVRFSQGAQAIGRDVAALRCGLDASAWQGDGAAHCAALLGLPSPPDYAAGNLPLPFDMARAHELYRVLFGQISEIVAGKRLLITASGPLSVVPFQVLLTAKPETPQPASLQGYADARWLFRDHAMTVLPSVTSLKSLRSLAKPSKARQPFMGFGNPLLLGPNKSDRRAWLRQTCADVPADASRKQARPPRAPTSIPVPAGLGDVDMIRMQYPLPETADELCAVARSTGAKETSVHLGQNASEKTIKALSASGALGDARILHFATHGLLAGETAMFSSSAAEPALILTPPAQASEADDGLLTASEVAQLRLDAEWVVLSACNTAAGNTMDSGSEALSGLARAFFYAGARALLVSHWAVDSLATVNLVTKAFQLLDADRTMTQAEAMRQSMRALVDSGGRNAHPANWAPFVVVGSGAR